MAETGFESTALKELCRIYIKWNFLRTNVQVKERSFTLIVIKQTKRILCMWAPKPPHRCYARIRAKSLQPCPTLWDPRDCSPPGSSTHRDSPGKNTGVGCRAFLQGIFPTQGSNPGLPHCRWILYQLSCSFYTVTLSLCSSSNREYVTSPESRWLSVSASTHKIWPEWHYAKPPGSKLQKLAVSMSCLLECSFLESNHLAVYGNPVHM